MFRRLYPPSCVLPLIVLVLCPVRDTYGSFGEEVFVGDHSGVNSVLEAVEVVKLAMQEMFQGNFAEARTRIDLLVDEVLQQSNASQAQYAEQFTGKFDEAANEIKVKTEKVMNYSSYQLDLIAKDIDRLSRKLQLKVLVAQLKRSLRSREGKDHAPETTRSPPLIHRGDIPLPDFDEFPAEPEVFLINATLSDNELYLVNDFARWRADNFEPWFSPTQGSLDLPNDQPQDNLLKSPGHLLAAPEVVVDPQDLTINPPEGEKEEGGEKVEKQNVLEAKEKLKEELSVLETKETQKEEKEVRAKEKEAPRDCAEILLQGQRSDGVYTIYPKGLPAVRVWCDQTTDGGGWTVLMARRNVEPHIDFAQNWTKYEEGFGDPEGEYWIGNKMIHELTTEHPQMLRADMEDWEGETAWAQYSSFRVEGAQDDYRLHVDDYDPTSTAGNGLEVHSNTLFSTMDRDNDQDFWMNCAQEYGGGWWYYRCFNVLGTGTYQVPKNVTFTTTTAATTTTTTTATTTTTTNISNTTTADTSNTTTPIPESTNSTIIDRSANTTDTDTVGKEVEYGGVEWRAWRELGYSLKTFQLKIRPQVKEDLE